MFSFLIKYVLRCLHKLPKTLFFIGMTDVLYQIDPSEIAPGAATGSVASRIRRDILSGELSFGSRLKLHALAARYRFGVTPIRGALLQLQGEGLVEMTPNCGARVRVVDAAFVSNLFDLRIVIEALLARRATERITAAQLAALDEAEIGYVAAVKGGEQETILGANRRFHDIVHEAAGNSEATAILARQRDITTALWSRFGYGAARATDAAADHRQMIAAFRLRDSDLAASLATAHAAKARNELLGRMGAAGSRS